jgi:hypothetical protein
VKPLCLPMINFYSVKYRRVLFYEPTERETANFASVLKKTLAQNCFNFMNTVAKFSYQLLPNSASDFSMVSSPRSFSR